MNDPSTTHAGYWDEVRSIWNLAQHTPGLPIPVIRSDSASFYFITIPHPDDAAEAVRDAEEILGYAFRVTFAEARTVQAGADRFSVRDAYLPSGLRLAIVARAEQADPRAYAVERVAAIGREVTMMQPAGAVA